MHKLVYVADSHAILWHLTNDEALGKKAKQILHEADAGKVTIVLPSIVLAELFWICKFKKVGLHFADLLSKIENVENYIIEPLSLTHINFFSAFAKISELHDLIIVATCEQYRAKLLSNDADIRKSGYVEIIWG